MSKDGRGYSLLEAFLIFAGAVAIMAWLVESPSSPLFGAQPWAVLLLILFGVWAWRSFWPSEPARQRPSRSRPGLRRKKLQRSRRSSEPSVWGQGWKLLGWSAKLFWSAVKPAPAVVAPEQLDLSSVGQLWALGSADFERKIADLLERLGFVEVERVGGSGDVGVDVQCLDEAGGLVVVQCKLMNRDQKVGSPFIQGFIGAMVHRRAKYGVFVSTCDFSPAALDLAHQHHIIPLDGVAVIRLMDMAKQNGGSLFPSKVLIDNQVEA